MVKGFFPVCSISASLMEITPKAMEIEYIHIKRFNLEIEKAYAIGLTAIHIHSLPYYWKNL